MILDKKIINRLKTEKVKYTFCHNYGEYDDYYSIWHDPGKSVFCVVLETSVWDGRGNEQFYYEFDITQLKQHLATKCNGTIHSADMEVLPNSSSSED